MSDASASHRRFTTATLAVLVAVLGLVAIGVTAPRASAMPVTMKFDHGRTSISYLFADKDVLPATSTFPSDTLPLPQRTDIELVGSVNESKLEFPSLLNSGLQFPYMHLMHPTEPDLKVPFTMRLRPPGLEGTWDKDTGEITDLAGKVDFIIVLGTGKLFPLPDGLDDLAVPSLNLFARCRISNVPVSFSTSGTRDWVRFKGQPFTDGLTKDGAMATFWDDLPNPTIENGDEEAAENCGMLGNLIHGEGGIWLSHGIAEPIIPPDPEPTCETDYRLCPPDPAPAIKALRLKPKKRAVKAGKRLMLKVRIRNTGDEAGTAMVKLKSSNRRVRIRKQVRVNVPAGSWAVKKVPLRFGKNARGKARVTARTHGLIARSNFKVKPRKKR